MKITNDVNNNSDLLSFSNKGDESASLLGSLFSINFNSNEVKSNNISDDFEFTFKEEDIEIIGYLSNIFTNLNITNLDISDFKRVESQIKSDQSIKTEIKDKTLSFLKTVQNHSKNFLIKLPEYNKLKALNNKNITNYKVSSKIKNHTSKALPTNSKNIAKAIDQ